MPKKVILDLCGGSGAWSKPFADAGFTIYNLTLPKYDLTERVSFDRLNGRIIFDKHSDNGLDYTKIDLKDIYGVLAAPPCTMFSLARTTAKTPRDFNEGMKLVRACMNIIWEIRARTKIKFWTLENPMGYLRQFLGKPAFTFDPCDFGDPYTKKTDLWGYFNPPKKKPIKLTEEELSRCKINNRKLPSIREITRQSDKRAITPPGFAKAFYEANK